MQKEKYALKVSLLAKIALVLNYISKDEFESLLAEIKAGRDAGLEVSETALMKRYVDQADFRRLSRDCAVFDSEQSDKRFGELCIAFGFLTPINLELALEEQKRLAAQGNAVPRGKMLVDAGILGSGQRDLILHKQKGFEEDERTGEKSKAAGTGHPTEDFDLAGFKQIREGGDLSPDPQCRAKGLHYQNPDL